MKKTLQSILVVSFLTLGFSANSQTRYLDDIFSSVNVISDVTYATNITILPALQGLPPAAAPLTCDIYHPDGDTETDRPVIIVAHTGSFLPPVINGQATGSKTDSSIVEQCTRWAKKGYVAVAMSYRLGWNPTSTDQNTRTSTLIQAAYRSIQDARSLIRFMRQEEAINGDPYGIDGSKIVFGGQGTGGYLSLGVATLDTTSELFLTKFLDLTDPANPMPYVIPSIFGNIYGTDQGNLPVTDSLGNFILDSNGVPVTVPFSLPNNIGYSSEISMAFNIGGCLADSSWLEAGDAPIVSFHCAKDGAGPYANGDVIVPTTGDFVIEAQGSYIVQKHQSMYGNNAPFASLNISDPITSQSVINNTTYDTINNYLVGNNYDGLYTFITPPPSTTPNAFGEYAVEQGAPWDWWDNATFEAISQQINGPAPAGYFAANAILDNPNMGPASGNLYIDTIQNYLNPRIFATLGFIAGCTDATACNYDANANIDDNSCDLPNGCGDPLYVEYDPLVTCSDPNACITLITTGINEVIDTYTKVYPNPANNSLNIVSNSVSISNISIYNVNNQEVYNSKVNAKQIKLDVSTFARGIYIIDIKSNITSVKKKLIIE